MIIMKYIIVGLGALLIFGLCAFISALYYAEELPQDKDIYDI